ncbi:MAG: hypothetical protein ACTHK7_19980 [Aureliella sp.]
MPCSLNATFLGPERESEGERIRGETIAHRLSRYFAQRGWQCGDADCWRDAGFAFSLQRDGEVLQIIIAPYDGKTDCWILQIAPSRSPGLIGRWFGSKPSASPECVYRAAMETQPVLSEAGYSGFQWCWDDLADGEHCSAEPSLPFMSFDVGMR